MELNIPEGVCLDVTVYARIETPDGVEYGSLKGRQWSGKTSLVDFRDAVIEHFRELANCPCTVTPCSKEEFDRETEEDDDE